VRVQKNGDGKGFERGGKAVGGKRWLKKGDKKHKLRFLGASMGIKPKNSRHLGEPLRKETSRNNLARRVDEYDAWFLKKKTQGCPRKRLKTSVASPC